MNPMKIFFLDAGRKFFSVDSVRRLMDAAAEAGLNAVVLYFSDNQGFRFRLKDMALHTDFGDYALSDVPGDGYCQDGKAPDGSGRFWEEADMEALLQYGANLGLEVIPALNMPGHLGAVLSHFPSLRYPGSLSSINLCDPEAVAFAFALLEKYALWFSQHGCRFFCFGADEFANDLGEMGFDVIYQNGEMHAFISFVNRAAEILTSHGLTPMCFNDGIYYHDDLTTYGHIDDRLWILYWIAGWNGYYPASPLTLSQAGFHLINACHAFYCGAGCPDWSERVEKMASFDYRIFDREIPVPDAAGGMLCCWCDRADFYGPDDGAELARQLPAVIHAFGKAINTHDRP